MYNITLKAVAKFYACCNMSLTNKCCRKLSTEERAHIGIINGSLIPLSDRGCDLIWEICQNGVTGLTVLNLNDEVKWWEKNLKKKMFRQSAAKHYNINVIT